MTHSPLRTLPTIILLALVLLASQAAPLVAAAPVTGVRPCFVPAHPLKQGKAPLPVGGAQGEYHDWHITADGTLGAAQAPIRTLNVAVLLVDFDDQPMDSTGAYFDTVLEYLDQIYDQQSDGQLVLNITRFDEVFRMPQDMSWYGLDDSIATREAQLVFDAVATADPTVDFAPFDTWMLFHAGAGQEADINEDSQEEIWSVFFRTVDLEFWGPLGDPRGVPTDDTDAMGDTVFVKSMVICPETEAQDGYDFGIMGVVTHEFGHRFTLPDLYDTTAPEGFIFAESQGIGTFGLMGAGIWNANGWFPAEMCAWSKFFVGWLRPEVIRPGVDTEFAVDLKAVVQDRRGGAVRIPLGGDEYFLIENRVRDYNGDGEFTFDDVNDNGVFDFGVDSYRGCELDWHLPQEPVNQQVEPDLDGSGLLVWHVDESVMRDNLFYNTVNANAAQKALDLEEADGIQDLDALQFTFEAFGDPKDAFFAPYATEFTPNSVPDSRGYHDARSEVWITDIPRPDSVMSFRVRFGGFEDGWPLDLPGLAADWQPMAADLDGDDVPEIVISHTDGAGQGGPVIYRPDGTFFGNGNPLTFQVQRSEPILADLDATDVPQLVWVAGRNVYAWDTVSGYLTAGGIPSPTIPEAWFVLPEDPGRVRISAADLDGDGFDEIVIGSNTPDGNGRTILRVAEAAVSGSREAIALVAQGVTGRPSAVGNVSDDPGLEIVTATGGENDGSIVVSNLDAGAKRFTFTLGDSVGFTAPVVGDLDQDGLDEIVVADQAGFVHVLRTTSGGSTADCVGDCLEELPGWPVFLGTLAADELSLADLDGDGYLEVLLFGPDNTFYAVNYNAVTVLEMPVTIPAENRFVAAYLSPLVLDARGEGPELVLPMPDGQVRLHDRRGRTVPGYAFLGGGNQGSYPVIADLDGDNTLEILTVEDITVAIPEDTVIEDGDLSDGVVRTGRVVVREFGSGTGEGPWPAYRGGPGRAGRAGDPSSVPAPGAGVITENFVMPNPATVEAGFHYRVADDVTRVTIEIFDIAGRRVQTLDGTTDPGVDNLVRWDLTGSGGSKVAPGVYAARVQADAPTGSVTTVYTFAVVR